MALLNIYFFVVELTFSSFLESEFPSKKKVQFHLEKKNEEIMAALQYKPQPKWKLGKKIQAAAYNGARTVYEFYFRIPLFTSLFVLYPQNWNDSLGHLISELH